MHPPKTDSQTEATPQEGEGQGNSPAAALPSRRGIGRIGKAPHLSEPLEPKETPVQSIRMDRGSLIHCPFCKTGVPNHTAIAGRMVRCATCRNVFRMPALDAVDPTNPNAGNPAEGSLPTSGASPAGPQPPLTSTPPPSAPPIAPPSSSGWREAGMNPPPASFQAQYPWRPVNFQGESASPASVDRVQGPDSGLGFVMGAVPGDFGNGPVEPPTVAEGIVEGPAESRLQVLWRTAPACVVSAAVHAGLLVLLAAFMVAGKIEEPLLLLEVGWNKPDVQPLDATPLKMDVEIPTPFDPSELAAMIPTASLAPAEPSMTVDVPMIDALSPPLGPKHAVGSNSPLVGRDEVTRALLVLQNGGTAESESAVAMGLDWIRHHQNVDGSWSFKHSTCPQCRGKCRNPGTLEAKNGATAMALLPFLGAGQTHRSGQYQDTVRRGLYYLVNQTKRGKGVDSGDLQGPGGNMYCHGLAAIALCEAYAMTQDQSLKEPAQKSIDFIAYAQDPTSGGWRYMPGQSGDTSAFGWQLMALKSAHMGYLKVPEKTILGSKMFLDQMQGDGGAVYGYTSPGEGAATTAIGLLSRMYMGWPKNTPALERGVGYLSDFGPSENDMYYNYYATQVLHHWGGPQWTRWNDVLRDKLVKSQETTGHERGSWWTTQSWSMVGGRLYQTAMSVMILEVYYRHLPIYRDGSVLDSFDLPTADAGGDSIKATP